MNGYKPAKMNNVVTLSCRREKWLTGSSQQSLEHLLGALGCVRPGLAETWPPVSASTLCV